MTNEQFVMGIRDLCNAYLANTTNFPTPTPVADPTTPYDNSDNPEASAFIASKYLTMGLRTYHVVNLTKLQTTKPELFVGGFAKFKCRISTMGGKSSSWSKRTDRKLVHNSFTNENGDEMVKIYCLGRDEGRKAVNNS